MSEGIFLLFTQGHLNLTEYRKFRYGESELYYSPKRSFEKNEIRFRHDLKKIQAGAELCQAQLS